MALALWSIMTYDNSFLRIFVNRLTKNQLVQVTWAGVAYYSCFANPLKVLLGAHHVLDSHPLLKKLVQHVGEIPSIEKYVKTRQVYQYAMCNVLNSHDC